VFVDQVPNPPSGWPPLDAVRDVATPVLNDWETYTANGWIFGIFDDLV